VWLSDNIYVLTVINDNNIEKHIYFDVYLQLKSVPENDGYSFNLTETWKARAMVDTGATNCAITNRMMKRMGLIPQDETTISHAMGRSKTPYYIFDVVFPFEKEFEDLKVVEIADLNDCDFIIGMNILSQGDMAITSENGKLCFSFICPPREKYIDFNEIYKE